MNVFTLTYLVYSLVRAIEQLGKLNYSLVSEKTV